MAIRGHLITVGGHIATVGGYIATIGGYIATVGGYIATIGGHIATFGGHIATVGGHIATIGHGRSAGKAIPLFLADQLVVGQALLVERGALLLHLRFGSLPGGLRFGDAGSSLSDFRLLDTFLRRFSVLAGHSVATLTQLTLPAAQTRALAHPG